jgi:microcystin-dependent protein
VTNHGDGKGYINTLTGRNDELLVAQEVPLHSHYCKQSAREWTDRRDVGSETHNQSLMVQILYRETCFMKGI